MPGQSGSLKELLRLSDGTVLEALDFSRGRVHYDLCQKDDDKYLFSVGIILYCSQEEQERFLGQSHEDMLAVLSALENGLATDEPRSTKAMHVFASHQVPASSSLFPKLSEVAVS